MADNWLDTLLNGLGGLGEKAISSAGLIALAKYLQDQADKGAVTYKEAKRELAAKSAGYETAMNAAAAPAGDVTAMRTALQTRAYNSPLKPLSVNPPGAFNPYAPTPGNPNGSMGGPVSPTMLAKVQSLAQNRNATTQWGGNALQTQLSQRMGTRDMRIGNKSGALTPLPINPPNPVAPTAQPGENQWLDALTKAKTPGTVDKPFIPGIGTGLTETNDILNALINKQTPGTDATPFIPGIGTGLSPAPVVPLPPLPGTPGNPNAGTGTDTWLKNYNPPDKTQFDLSTFLQLLQMLQKTGQGGA